MEDPPALRYVRVSRPAPRMEGVRMAGFLFRLETVEGEPASPPTLEAAIPNWGVGDRIYFGARTLQVIGRRDDDADQPPVLVVEDVAG